MKIIRPAAQPGPPGKAGSQFTGAAYPYLTMAATDDVVINTVNFTPGARTFWHRHERGQILLVIAGRGLIQAGEGAVRVMRAGDTIWCPPGERHWHGAAGDSYVVHTAISLGTTQWEAEVSEDEFGAAPLEGDDDAG